MHQLIYISRARHAFSDGELVELLTASRTANAAERITGVLLFAEGTFIQCLEGEATAVDRLMRRIARDPRHAGLLYLYRAETRLGRVFPHWSMGFRHMRFMDRLKIAGLEENGLAELNGILELNRGSPVADILQGILAANPHAAA